MAEEGGTLWRNSETFCSSGRGKSGPNRGKTVSFHGKEKDPEAATNGIRHKEGYRERRKKRKRGARSTSRFGCGGMILRNSSNED